MSIAVKIPQNISIYLLDKNVCVCQNFTEEKLQDIILGGRRSNCNYFKFKTVFEEQMQHFQLRSKQVKRS